MLKKKDIIIIVIILLLAIIAYAILQTSNNGKTPNGTVDIYLNGQLYETVEIEDGKEFVIEQPDGKINILEFSKTGVKMKYSNCDNQLCVQQSKVTYENYAKRSLGTSIICLPHRLTITLNLEDSPIPTVEPNDIPDIF